MSEKVLERAQGRSHGKLTSAILILFIVFLVVFPKGGVKVGNVPITIGYMVFALFLIFLVTVKVGKPVRIARLYGIELALMLPFFVFVLIGFFLSLSSGLGVYEFIALVNFIILPFSIVFLLRKEFSLIDREWLYRKISLAAVVTAFYGIFLFFWFVQFGSYLEIPYLTVNQDDVDSLLEKSNLRFDGVSKLISTYNNGNIYAICMLMLLPLVLCYQKSKFAKIVFVVAIALTLSRTAWAGLIFYYIFSKIYDGRVGVEKILKVSIFVVFVVFIVYFVAYFFDYVDFVFDSSLGGRVAGFELFEFRFLPSGVFAEISENSYVTILNIYGLLGFLAYLIFMVSPYLAVRLNVFICGGRYVWDEKGRRERFCVSMGMANYLFVSFADGALMLIPVLFIYFVLMAFYLVMHNKSFFSFSKV